MVNPAFKFPNRRIELCGHLEFMQNEDAHRSAWIHDHFRAGDPTLLMIIHFVFDDTSLFDDPLSCIGEFLKDEREANAIRPLTAALDALAYCETLSSEADYVAMPQWKEVVVAARAAHALICGSEPTRG